MKKKLKRIFLMLCALICLNAFVGCSWIFSSGKLVPESRKWEEKYMDSVEVECSEYRIIDEKEDGSARTDGVNMPVDLTIHDKDVHIEEVRTELNEFDYYLVKLDGKEIKFTTDYFALKSAAFNKIIAMWDDYKNGSYKVDVDSVSVDCFFDYDGELFVSVLRNAKGSWWDADWTGCIPRCYFRFDVSDYSLEYVGYSNMLTAVNYIIKN